ncbi:hypothetical protein H6P81_008128 [Aristolochia fimbriata]|uniref:Uncharacterized protein n=1 Tax=Aristolochia fimbriata TaxID=158543 RepID=A0AAV7F3D4_ARIFI|nr:hypothetical protein H6P81_008128 [Aristolochia fimbriata]
MAVEADDVAKVTISGPTLAAILQRASTAAGDIDGLLFGHVSQPPPSELTDDDQPSANAGSSLIATVTSHFSSNSILSFYDSLGRIYPAAVARCHPTRPAPLLGWFVSRRRTALRPSMREVAVSASLAKTLSKDTNLSQYYSQDQCLYRPLIFLLVSTPLTSNESLIHTHEYRAFLYRPSGPSFEPKSIDVLNIGPAFRGNYGAFSPNSALPFLPFGAAGPEEETKESLDRLRTVSNEQRVLDSCAEGYDVGRLRRMVGPEATNYASQVEDLYCKMLAKLEGLARVVEKSSAQVLEQGLLVVTRTKCPYVVEF